MTKEQAYALASQWGSYMNDSDPGACFYAFHANNGRPQDEEHRAQCLEHARSCEKIAHGRHWTLQADETDLETEQIAQDVDDLRELIAFFETTPLRSAENQNV